MEVFRSHAHGSVCKGCQWLQMILVYMEAQGLKLAPDPVALGGEPPFDVE